MMFMTQFANSLLYFTLMICIGESLVWLFSLLIEQTAHGLEDDRSD